MSYAGTANLITLQLADSSAKVDSRLTRMLATSLVVHAVLLLGFMSVKFAPTLQQPLASYYIDLVTLPELSEVSSSHEPTIAKNVSVSPPVKAQAPLPESVPVISKTPPAPEQPASSIPVATKPSPAKIEPIQTERVTPSIMDAVDNVALPQSREMTPIMNVPVVAQAQVQAPINKASQAISMPSVPQAPQLFPQKVLPPITVSKPSSSSTSSLAETLKQAVQSVAVPQKPQQAKASISAPAQERSKPISSTVLSQADISPKIFTPGQAPQMAKVVPVPKFPEHQPSRPQHHQTTDSVKQVLQSVVVPKMRKSQVSPSKSLPAVPVPIPSIRDTPPKPRKKLAGIVIPADAPKLAVVEVKKSLTKKTAEVPPRTVRPDVLNPTIAKLVIPHVKVPDVHHILSKPTERGLQNTTTALQVSGSSPKGNAYWGRVWSKIDREWIAPKVGMRSGQLLQVVLAFRIERNGGVRNLTIEHSSGNEYYDRAAKRAVLDASPLPPFGSDMSELFYDIQFQFTVNVDP